MIDICFRGDKIIPNIVTSKFESGVKNTTLVCFNAFVLKIMSSAFSNYLI